MQLIVGNKILGIKAFLSDFPKARIPLLISRHTIVLRKYIGHTKYLALPLSWGR